MNAGSAVDAVVADDGTAIVARMMYFHARGGNVLVAAIVFSRMQRILTVHAIRLLLSTGEHNQIGRFSFVTFEIAIIVVICGGGVVIVVIVCVGIVRDGRILKFHADLLFGGRVQRRRMCVAIRMRLFRIASRIAVVICRRERIRIGRIHVSVH